MRSFILEIIRQKWRVLIVLTILLLLNLILSVVVSVYQLPELSELQTKWHDLRRKDASTGQVDAVSLYKQGVADIEKLKTRIPVKRDFARVLSELYESAASSGVEVGTVSYKPTQTKDEPLLSYQLTLSVNGSYAAVKSFLSDLQSKPELLVVDTVAFSNSDIYVENVLMDLRITVYLREGV